MLLKERHPSEGVFMKIVGFEANGGLHLGRVSTQSEEDPAHRWLRERINELATEVASPELPLRKEDR